MSSFGNGLSGLVSKAAESDPTSVAALCDDQELTWAEFSMRVGSLVSALQGYGVAPGDRVGIYLHKSLDSLVAVHAILSAGAAYVPIDPLASAELAASVIDNCGIEVLVSHEPRRQGLRRLGGLTKLKAVIGLDRPIDDASLIRSTPWLEVASLSEASPVSVTADMVAYIMFTSGSTGRPKGITHTHGSGFAYVEMAAGLYGLSADDRMVNFSPLHFDMSTFEALAGVYAGSTVLVLSEPLLRFPASLTSYLADRHSTIWYTVPSLLQQMVSRGSLADHDWSSVRWVNPAGEVFAAEALAQFMANFPNARFSNVYGPAEVNQCTYYHFNDPPADGRPVPIGYASGDAELLVVDDDMNPTDVGNQGELLVASSTMAAGYWQQPEMTKAAFTERVEPNGTYKRWHRTGDLVEIDENGLVRFHGRRDHQVKVRGNRVELEGVEAAVGDLDGIENAVVGVQTDSSGNARLVSYYTADQAVNSSVNLAETSDVQDWASQGEQTGATGTLTWRKQLTGVLPSYAVPVEFVAIEHFPMTPSGKIDRRAVRAEIASRGPDNQ